MSDDEDLCPDWLFEDDHPDSYFMPLNALTYTQPEVVRRVRSDLLELGGDHPRHRETQGPHTVGR